MKTAIYKQLLEYYNDLFHLIDQIHYNSNIAKERFESVLGHLQGITIPISNCEINDHRKIKHFSEKGLCVGFIGNETPYKGLNVLRSAIRGLDIDVMVWGGKKGKRGRVFYRGKFVEDQLNEVYSEMDLLVVPSIWKETFSLVTLEALSYGVPVLVSDNVGAQDVVKEYDKSFVYHTEEELREKLELLVKDKSQLLEYNKRIISHPWRHDIFEHAQEIIDRIYKNYEYDRRDDS